MSLPVIHKSFTIERTYPTTAVRVFRAHSDPKKKRRWFAEGEGFIVARSNRCTVERTAPPESTATTLVASRKNIGAWIMGRNMFGPLRAMAYRKPDPWYKKA